MQVPAAKRRNPNDPAVYVARRFGWYRVAMMRALLTVTTDADGNNDVDNMSEEAEAEAAISLILPTLNSKPRAANTLANPAKL